jgi:hypothetical protein
MVIGAPGPDGRAVSEAAPAFVVAPTLPVPTADELEAEVASETGVEFETPMDSTVFDAAPVAVAVAADPSPEATFTTRTKATPTELAVARSAGARVGRDQRLPNPLGAPFVVGAALPVLGPMLTAGVAQDESAIGKAVAPTTLGPDEAAAWEQGFADAHRERLRQQFATRAAAGSVAGIVFWVAVTGVIDVLNVL